MHISQDHIYALTNNEIKFAPLSSLFYPMQVFGTNINIPIGSNIKNLESINEDFYAFGSTNIVYKYHNNNWDTTLFYPNETLEKF